MTEDGPSTGLQPDSSSVLRPSSSVRTMAERLIRASEVAQYVFCHRAWWLAAVQGIPSANVRELEAGEIGHARHGRSVSLARALRAVAYLALVLALITGAIWLWWSLSIP